MDVLGRDDELRSLRAFLDRPAGAGMTALVLEGEAGIGKSTLWLAGVEAARERGFRVLSSRPAEVESGLPTPGWETCWRTRSRTCAGAGVPSSSRAGDCLAARERGERAGRFPNACGRRSQRSPGARRARADPGRGRRRPVVGPALHERPCVLAQAIAEREHPAPVRPQARGRRYGLGARALAGRRLGRARAGRLAQSRRFAGDPATAARPGARTPDVAAPP